MWLAIPSSNAQARTWNCDCQLQLAKQCTGQHSISRPPAGPSRSRFPPEAAAADACASQGRVSAMPTLTRVTYLSNCKSDSPTDSRHPLKNYPTRHSRRLSTSSRSIRAMNAERLSGSHSDCSTESRIPNISRITRQFPLRAFPSHFTTQTPSGFCCRVCRWQGSHR